MKILSHHCTFHHKQRIFSKALTKNHKILLTNIKSKNYRKMLYHLRDWRAIFLIIAIHFLISTKRKL